MKNKSILLSIVFLACQFQVLARMPILNKSFDFFSQSKLNLHSGSKVKLRFNHLPNNVDLVQISVPGNLKENIQVIGLANKNVERSGLGNFVEFTIQIPELDENWPSNKNLKIRLKSFQKKSYLDNSYSVLASDIKTISPIICPKETKPVCGIVRSETKDEFYTFENFCDMEKYGGMILYEGECLID